MALDSGMVGKTIRAGVAKALENGGSGLKLTATLTANIPKRNNGQPRRLTWAGTGNQWHSAPTTLTVNEGEEVTFADVPATNSTGWRLDGQAPELGPTDHVFTYTLSVSAKQGAKTTSMLTATFTIAENDPSSIDVDTLMEATTASGAVVSIVDNWTALTEAAAASAAAAEVAAAGNDAGVSALIETPATATRTALDAAIENQAAPATTLYVHPTRGSDTNSGLVPGSPKATLAGALAAAPADGQTTFSLAYATHVLTSPITWDASKHRVTGTIGTLIDASAITSGSAVTLAAPSAVSPYYINRTLMENIRITGNGGTGAGNRTSTVVGLDIDSSLSPNQYAISHGNLVNVNVDHFGTGIRLGSHAYCLNFVNADVWECGVGVYAPNGTTDAGERLQFIGSTIFNSDLGVWAANQNGSIDLIGTSVDYCSTWLKAENSVIRVMGGHLERSVTDSAAPIIITGTQGSVQVTGGTPMIFTGTFNSGTAPAVVVQNDNTGSLYGAESVFDVILTGVRTSTGAFASGAGRTVLNIRSTNGTTNQLVEAVNFADNAMADGGFESTANGGALVDYISITRDTAITSPSASTNLSVGNSTTANPRSGSRHLRITKTTSNATATQVDVLVPVTKRGAIPFVRFYIAKPGSGLVGSISTPVIAALVKPSTTAGVPVIAKEQQISSSSNGRTLTSSALAYTQVTPGTQHQRMPEWATHLIIRFFFNTDVTAGDLDVDDIYVGFA